MNETLGKRIACHRKALGLTQDQLAEKIGVTAQAVSKWENDQSCPDISTLPRLAGIFDITTDALLGVEPKKLAPLEAPKEAKEPVFGIHYEQNGDDDSKHNFEFHYDGGRKSGIGIALWILLTAALLFLSHLRFHAAFSLWDCLWPSGLLVFGLFGLYPKFSVLRLGCALFGGCYAINMTTGVMLDLDRGLLLPLLLLLFGLNLLFDALRKPKKGHFRINGIPNGANYCDTDGECFQCSTSFGEDTYCVQLPKLSQGSAQVSFGEMTVDLRGCQQIAQNCPISLDCAFGELELLIPQGCRAEWTVQKAFGSLDLEGTPSPNAQTVLQLKCDVSFGQITIHYL